MRDGAKVVQSTPALRSSFGGQVAWTGDTGQQQAPLTDLDLI